MIGRIGISAPSRMCGLDIRIIRPAMCASLVAKVHCAYREWSFAEGVPHHQTAWIHSADRRACQASRKPFCRLIGNALSGPFQSCDSEMVGWKHQISSSTSDHAVVQSLLFDQAPVISILPARSNFGYTTTLRKDWVYMMPHQINRAKSRNPLVQLGLTEIAVNCVSKHHNRLGCTGAAQYRLSKPAS